MLHTPRSVPTVKRCPKDNTQKSGDHLNFRKNGLGVKRPFSELSESSGVFSEQLSELEIPFSEYEIPLISRLEQYENDKSRSNSRSDSRNGWEPR